MRKLIEERKKRIFVASCVAFAMILVAALFLHFRSQNVTPGIAAGEGATDGQGMPSLLLLNGSPPPKAPRLSPAPAAISEIAVRFQAGDYNAALQLARQALENAALEAEAMIWLKKNMPILLASAAWAQIKTGACSSATDLLIEAHALQPSKETAKGLAWCSYLEKNFVMADEFFLQLREFEPEDVEMPFVHADVLESQQRFDDALQLLQHIKATDAKTETLKKNRIAAMQGKLNESVHQTTTVSDHFELLYRAEEHENLVEPLLATLETALEELSDRFGFPSIKEPVQVILYAKESFRDVVPGGPDWLAGVFDGRMRIPIREEYHERQGFGQLSRILRHELVHALLARKTGHRFLPTWFNEGLAQRFECQDNSCDATTFSPTPGGFLPIHMLEQPFISFSRPQAERGYRQSLYLIRTLEASFPEGMDDHVLPRMIEQLSDAGELSSDRLLAPLGVRFAEIHALAAEYWRKQHRF